MLREAGATEVAVFHTGPWLLKLTAREFFDQVIIGQLGARGMVEGPNFAFGHDRKGDVATLRRLVPAAGIDFEVVDATLVGGRLISSSLIRQSLRDGHVEQATELLGRPHRIRGRVSHGAGRGRGLGFPTINLSDIDVLVPAEGVYAARAWAEGRGRPGRRPAISGRIRPSATKLEKSRLISSVSRATCMARSVELDFLTRLRATRPFSSVEELSGQIQADVDETRRICAGQRPPRIRTSRAPKGQLRVARWRKHQVLVATQRATSTTRGNLSVPSAVEDCSIFLNHGKH